MTKQEDVFYILQDVRLGELSEYEATLKLQELGVVIKVRRKLPLVDGTFEDFSECSHPFNFHEGYWVAQQDMKKAGYVAVEPLIEEKQKSSNSSGEYPNTDYGI